MTSDPRPGLAALFDRAAPTYDAVDAEFFTPVARQLVATAGLRPGDRVLDVGTGRGACLYPAATLVGPTGRVLGIDLSPAMVAATAADVAAAGLPQVRVARMDGQEPDVEPGGFDVVLAGLALIFLPDPAAGLLAWARALRPAGRLAISTFGPPDRAWDVLDEVATAYAGEGGTIRPPGTEGGPFSSAERLAELLTACGYTGVRSDDRVQEVRYRDAAHWWEWQWSVGARAAWERVPPARLPEARAAAMAAAEQVGGRPDGSVVWRPTIRYTTAVKA